MCRQCISKVFAFAILTRSVYEVLNINMLLRLSCHTWSSGQVCVCESVRVWCVCVCACACSCVCVCVVCT